MNFLIWTVIIGLFIFSFLALIYPVFPSVGAIWAGFLFYHFFISSLKLTRFFWLIMTLFTLIILLSSIFASSLSVKKYGGTKLGRRVAAVSVVISSFVYPPFGIIVLPFIAVFLAEWSQERSWRNAWNTAIGSLVGFLVGK